MKTLFKSTLYIVLLLITSVSLADDKKISILEFGDHLYKEGDYYRAITEYKRVLFMNKKDDASKIQHRIAMAYFNGEKYETAEEIFRDISINSSDEQIRQKCKSLLATCYYKTGDYSMSISVLQNMNSENDDELTLKIGWCHFMSGNSKDAFDSFSLINDTSKQRSSAERLLKEIENYDDLPRKVPAVAGTLSAILPGAGQAYNGKYRDGLTSFFLNGIFIWGTIAAFENDEDVAGTFSALIAASWYSGNIYNAVSGSHKVNRDVRKKFLHGVNLSYGITIAGDEEMQLMPVFSAKAKF